MNKSLLDKNMEQIVLNFAEGKRVQLQKELERIDNPKTLGELLDHLNQELENKSSLTTHYFRVIENLEEEELFPYVLNTIDRMDNDVYKEYAFRSLSAISKDVEQVDRYIPLILKTIETSRNYRVIYQGVATLYKMVKIHPELSKQLNEKRIRIDLPLIQDILNMLKHVDKWEEDFHKNSDVRTPLGDPDEFLNFASGFIAF